MAALAAALALQVPAAQAAGPGWRAVLEPAGSATSLGAVTTTGAGQVWAVGGATAAGGLPSPAVWRRTSSGWQRQVLPGTWSTSWGYATAVAASSPDDVWVTAQQRRRTSGADGAFLAHWDGTSWQRRAVPGAGVELAAVVVRAPGDAWFAGTDLSSGGEKGEAVLLHWDGTALTRVSVPVLEPTCTPSLVRTTALGADAGSVWLGLNCQLTTDARQRGVVQRLSGGAWSPAAALPPSSGVLALSDRAGVVWVTGSRQVAGPDTAPVVLRGTVRDGFQDVPVPGATGTILWGVAATASGAYLVGEGRPAQTPVVLRARTSAGSTTLTGEPAEGSRALFGVAVDAAGTGWAVGPAFGGSLGGQDRPAAVYRRQG